MSGTYQVEVALADGGSHRFAISATDIVDATVEARRLARKEYPGLGYEVVSARLAGTPEFWKVK
jgi:hypothetical protein